MAKRELAENEITGYLHEVSPIKISKANNSYFVGKLQTDTNVFQKMVCFDQSKHSSFHEATAAKTPVKICNVKNVQSREDSSKIDVLVNAKSQMHVVRNLNFQHHLDDSVADDNKTLVDILHIPEKNKVDIKAKVLEVHQDTCIDVRGKLMRKQDIILGDMSATIRLCVWEPLIGEFKVNQSYSIGNISTRLFNDEKFLTTTKGTTKEEIDPMENVHPLPPKEEPLKMNGVIAHVSITKNISCGVCGKKIIPEAASTIVRCTYCNMKQKLENTVCSLLGNLTIKGEEKTEKLSIFHAQLVQFLLLAQREDLRDDANRLEDFLLNQENIFVEYDSNKTVKRMTQ